MKETPSIHAAFLNAFNNIGNAIKNSNNPHFKSKYANLETVIDQIRPALKEYGLFFIQSFNNHELATTMDLKVWNEYGEHLSLGTICLPVINKDNPQALKSSITLLRRAQLLAAFGMAEIDDDGNEAVKGFDQTSITNHIKPLAEKAKQIINHAPGASSPVNTDLASPAQQKMFWGKIEETGWTEMNVQDLFKNFKLEDFKKASKKQASEMIKIAMEGPALYFESIPF